MRVTVRLAEPAAAAFAACHHSALPNDSPELPPPAHSSACAVGLVNETEPSGDGVGLGDAVANVESLRQTHSTYNHAGDPLARQGRLGEALDYYQRGMAYAARMSAVNDSPQVAFLRSESHRKLGEAYLALAAGGRDSGALAEARAHLQRAHEGLSALQQRNELGKNHRYKLTLVAADMERAARLSAGSGRGV